MPGLVVFGRRWAFGSDDVIIPAGFHSTFNLVWTLLWLGHFPIINWNRSNNSSSYFLWLICIAHIVILCSCCIIELAAVIVSSRGTVLNNKPRDSIKYIIYARLAILIVQLPLCLIGIGWLYACYHQDIPGGSLLCGMTVWHLLLFLVVLLTIWISYDPAGRRWVRLRKFQNSVTVRENDRKFRRSGTSQRNWRRRKIMLAYRDSWRRRCRILSCCTGFNDVEKNSFAEIAQLFSEFFRELDLVPTDVIAGLMLLRHRQKVMRNHVLEQTESDTYQFLSGAAVTPRTKFLFMDNEDDFALITIARYYMQYALGAYGWPFYFKYHSGMDIIRLFSRLKCCACCCAKDQSEAEIESDNCCRCNLASLRQTLPSKNIELVYVSFHVGIGESPFYVAVDHDKQSVVVCIRGTLSLKDLLTDLTATGEEIPVMLNQKDIMGHKGIVKSAIYIKKKLEDKKLLQRAFSKCERGYKLTLVGHSLGGGVGAVLGMMLRQRYRNLHCYCFAPPGGLITQTAVEYSKEFVTSFVVGKDVVIRSGLPQLESLRHDILSVLKRSTEHKWRIIGRSLLCCPLKGESHNSSAIPEENGNASGSPEGGPSTLERLHMHPTQANLILASHSPMYPPGKIIHIVRKWTKYSKKSNKPEWTAMYAENDSFDEVNISPVMVHDHMPDGVLQGLDMLLSTRGSRERKTSAFVVPTRDKKSHMVVNPLGAPIAESEASEVPLHTASLLSAIERGADPTDQSVATMTSFDNLSRPSLPSLENVADEDVSGSGTTRCTEDDYRTESVFRPDMNSEYVTRSRTPDDWGDSSPFLVRSCPAVVNRGLKPNGTGTEVTSSEDSDSTGNITSGSFYIDWPKPVHRLSEEYILTRTISTIHEVSETADPSSRSVETESFL